LNQPLDNHPCKIPNTGNKLHRWKSWRANTPFAPSFDIPIFNDTCDEELSDKVLKLISDNEVGMSSDVANSLNTTYQKQWSMYNIFAWNEPEIVELSRQIYKSYCEFLTSLLLEPIPPDKLWIRGWAVVLTEGERLETHCHAFHENTYLSGNISLSDLGTTTDYWFPSLSLYFDWWRASNKVGSLTLFPSWLEHRVLPNESGQLRFSIGFDLFTEYTMKYINLNRNEESQDQNVILLSKTFAELWQAY
jgi:hypothetical protein